MNAAFRNVSLGRVYCGPRIPVAIFGDHAAQRDGMARMLETVPDLQVAVVGGARAEVLDFARSAEQPPVVLLDVRLSDASGITTSRELRSAQPAAASLLMSPFQNEEVVLQSMLARAVGVVPKQLRGVDPAVVIRRAAACRGQVNTWLDGDGRSAVLTKLRLRPVADETIFDRRLRSLTNLEREIADLASQDLADEAIAELLHLHERTVRRTLESVLVTLGFGGPVSAQVLPLRASGVA